MRKLTLTALVFSLLVFSSTSFADWKKVGEIVSGTTIYVDFLIVWEILGFKDEYEIDGNSVV